MTPPTLKNRRLQIDGQCEPEIGFTAADRIEPGEYPAYARSARVYRDPQFRRWVCAIQFDILDPTRTRVLARVTWFLNLGDGERPHAGRRSLFMTAWIAANGRPPSRRDRLAKNVFVNRHARVVVGDTQLDHRQRPVSGDMAYSVVRSVTSWETGASQ